MRFGVVAVCVALAAPLSGCGHVPLTTMAKLRNFDASRVDPAELRIAMRAPDWLEPRSEGASLKFKLSRRDGSQAREETFRLEPAEAPAETAKLGEHRRPGQRIWAWRPAPADFARIRAFQEEGRTLRAADPTLSALNIAPSLDACRRGEMRSGPIDTTTLLQPDSATGYLVLLDAVDLREAAKKAGVDLDETLPACGKSALRAQ